MNYKALSSQTIPYFFILNFPDIMYYKKTTSNLLQLKVTLGERRELHVEDVVCSMHACGLSNTFLQNV